MNVPEISQIKNHLALLQKNGLIKQWELPYEELLTRRSAAIFFITPTHDQHLNLVWQELDQYDNFIYRENEEKRLSELEYRITFNKEEKRRI